MGRLNYKYLKSFSPSKVLKMMKFVKMPETLHKLGKDRFEGSVIFI